MSEKPNKNVIKNNPLGDYSDIKKDVVKLRKYKIGFSRGNIDENGKESPSKPHDLFPLSPYKDSLITKKSTSLGRKNHGYSLSTELFLRIKMLASRMTHDNIILKKNKRVTESELIEMGMRYVLKKYRYKYKDLPFNEDGDV